MGLSYELVRTVRYLQEVGIPEEVREQTKLHIMDTIGISLPAHKHIPIMEKAINAVVTGVEGGSGRVIGSDQRMPPAYAAFVNTALAHALDFDDIHDQARIHPTPVTLAAALSVADVEENRGTDLVTAVAIGNEIMCRFGLAVEPRGTAKDKNWFLSQLFGYVGAAISAGLVLGLDDSELIHAIGFAYMQAAGGKEAGVGMGSEARSIYPAFASMGGVQAAFLSRAGISAPASSLDGKTGLFRVYLEKDMDQVKKGVLLDKEKWYFLDTSIKLFPSCRYSHPFIVNTRKLREKVELDQIRRIVLGVNQTAKMLCEPLEERCHPKTIQDAKFSIPFMVAFTLVYGEVNLNNLNEESLSDSNVLELTKVIEVEQTRSDEPGLPIGDIKVLTENAEYHISDHFDSSFNIERVKSKFIECCTFAEVEVTKSEKLWETLYQKVDYNLFGEIPILVSSSNYFDMNGHS